MRVVAEQEAEERLELHLVELIDVELLAEVVGYDVDRHAVDVHRDRVERVDVEPRIARAQARERRVVAVDGADAQRLLESRLHERERAERRGRAECRAPRRECRSCGARAPRG